ncbi:hypothetical protein C479_05383 [Halovivax asiaticus JCM 14624]|uniref:Uncharacterized protein n=1 Tax=Halovivax asiaticus JCM 14624 TaxID=1227490 RepID=M0BR95_9EURY|nr:hypothetical protein [Halovivax asiaticus]ELZ12214.1 hypothetical protein C479_05383 [Halovivax asiaticus JCM 14624]
MDSTESVPWADVIAVRGVPGEELQPFVQRDAPDLDGRSPAEAVKVVYDDWKETLGDERTLDDQGAAYLIAYLLEHRGVIHLDDTDAFGGSLLDRKPDDERLRELFHDEERTLWWIGVECGVHHSLVSRWLYEADIPLLARNLNDETVRKLPKRPR